MSLPTINDSNGLLLYRVGPILVCSSTMPVEAVIMPPKITVPPGANVAEPGVFKSIHGMVRLVDLRVRFGVDEEDYTQPGKIIIVEVEGGYAGFWVDEIEDVTGFPTKGWAQVPAYIPKNVFSRTWIQDQKIRLYTDFEKLDKFKSTGYLRKHIEMIKTQNVATAPDKTLKDKQIKKIATKQKSEIKSSKVIFEDNIKDSVLEKMDKCQFNKLGASVEKKLKPKINHKTSLAIKESVSSRLEKKETQKIAQHVGRLKSENNISKEKNEHNSNSVLAEDKRYVKKRKASNNTEDNLTAVAMTERKITQQKKQSEEAPKSRGGLKWLYVVGAAGVAVIYFILSLSIFDDAPKKNIASKERFKVVEISEKKNEIFYEPEIIVSTDNSVISTNENIETSQENIVIEEATVNISKVEGGMLIVINEYEEKSTTTNEGVHIKDSGFVEKHEAGVNNENDSQDALVLNSTESANKNFILNDSSLENATSQKTIANKIDAREEATVISIDENKVSKNVVEIDEIESAKIGLVVPLKETDQIDMSATTESSENKKIAITKKTAEPLNNKIEKTNKLQSREYVHVVIKGDTLWHIAKRYVNNPWRYPELAKLSRIKNPDLIYPGDRVTIIINYKN